MSIFRGPCSLDDCVCDVYERDVGQESGDVCVCGHVKFKHVGFRVNPVTGSLEPLAKLAQVTPSTSLLDADRAAENIANQSSNQPSGESTATSATSLSVVDIVNLVATLTGNNSNSRNSNGSFVGSASLGK